MARFQSIVKTVAFLQDAFVSLRGPVDLWGCYPI